MSMREHGSPETTDDRRRFERLMQEGQYLPDGGWPNWRRMARQTRMVATLVALVVSMTGTSAVLSWLDPSLPAGFNCLPASDIVALAGEAVTQDVVVDPGRWHEIEVVPDRPHPRSTLLSAIANRPPIAPGDPSSSESGQARSPWGEESDTWHFRIMPDGRPIRDVSWRDQKRIGEASNAVRIWLGTASSSGASITSAQWLCLRALVAAINESTGSGNAPLTVVVGGQADRATRHLLEAHLR
ncbi:MAG: hypothetical protein ACE5E5_00665 [Phycisphaerae bacterium]